MSGVFEVRLTGSAELDLEEIFQGVRTHWSDRAAEKLLDDLLVCIDSLEHHPARSAAPAELTQIGIGDYRQILFQHYRVIYRIIDQTVVVLLIADGRRDMQSLLERRLFEQ